MKTNLFFTGLIIKLLVLTLCFTSCGKDDSEDDVNSKKESGYAPSSINGKEITFNRNGTWNFSSTVQGSSTVVQINADVTYIAYEKAKPECIYKKTGDNTAQYTLSFYHKAYVSYTKEYAYGYNYYDLKLQFTSSTGGTYSGTRSNGTTKESRTGTFTLAK